MKFWIKTIEDAIALFNTNNLFKKNDNIDIPKLTEEEEEFIRKNHKSILKKYKIDCFCWKPDQEGYIRYNIKNSKLGLIKLFRDQIDTFNC